MRTRKLDKRVRTEAVSLVHEARTALMLKRVLADHVGPIQVAIRDVEDALAAKDYARVRRDLPVLDAMIDEPATRPGKSVTRDYAESIIGAILIALALRAMVLEAFKIPSSSMYPTLEINDHIFVNKFLYGLHIPFTTTKLLEWRKPQRGEVIVFIQPCTPERDYIKRVIATAGQSVEVRCNTVYVDDQPVERQLVQGDTCSYDDYDEKAGTWSTKPCSEYTERVDGHEYHTFQDSGLPRREDQRAKGATPYADGNDFPHPELHDPPSCEHQIDGETAYAPNQQPGKLVETKKTAGACELQLHYVVPEGHVFVMGDNRANSRDARIFGAVPIENIKGKALFIWLSYRYWDPLHWGGLRWNRIGSFVR
jgi:signal peptidase I